MFLNRLKLTAAGLVATGLLAAGLGSLWATTPTPTPRFAPRTIYADAKDAGPWKVKYTITHAEAVTAVAFGADIVASGDADGNVTLWDATTGKEKEKLVDVAAFNIPNKAPVDSLAFNPDSTWLYTINMERTALHACRLDPKNRLFPGFGGAPLKMFGFSPDGAFYMNASGKNLSIFKNTFADNVIGGLRDGDLKADQNIAFAAITPDNETIVIVTEKHSVAAYGFGFSPKQVWATDEGKFEVTSLVVSPNGKLAAVTAKDGTVRLFDCATGKAADPLKGHTGAANAVAFSPDGKRLASAGDDHMVRVWEVATGKAIATLKGHADAVKSVAFSPDGSQLVSGSADKTVKVWQLGK